MEYAIASIRHYRGKEVLSSYAPLVSLPLVGQKIELVMAQSTRPLTVVEVIHSIDAVTQGKGITQHRIVLVVRDYTESDEAAVKKRAEPSNLPPER